MGPDITFCPAVDAQLKPNEHNRARKAERPQPLDSDQIRERNTFWVFELEDDGTVIYSHPRIIDADSGSITNLEGHNFFEEMRGFENLAKCRQHFRSFVNSNKAAEKFIWRCSSASGTMDTNVLMTRGFQTGYRHPTGVVMMEIRAS